MIYIIDNIIPIQCQVSVFIQPRQITNSFNWFQIDFMVTMLTTSNQCIKQDLKFYNHGLCKYNWPLTVEYRDINVFKIVVYRNFRGVLLGAGLKGRGK